MLLHQHPAITYIMWQGLVIVEYKGVDENREIESQYIITDDKTCDKYVYWDKNDPYILKTSNDWVTSTATTKLLFINDNGEGTEVPVDGIDYFYTSKGSSNGNIISGKMLGMFNEIDGKFIAIEEDIDGINRTIGELQSEGGLDGSTLEKLNKLEQTAEGNKQLIQTIKTEYDTDKEEKELIDTINMAFIDIMTALSEYENVATSATDDLELSSNEQIDIINKQNQLNAQLRIINDCHEIITSKIVNIGVLDDLEETHLQMNNAITALNSLMDTLMSDGTLKVSDITTMLNAFASSAYRIKEYQGVLSDSITLGVGGSVLKNIHTMTETAREYNRGILEIEEVVNGETGLVETVKKQGTWITQTAEDLSLKYVKYDKATAELTVSDETIKLDAKKVLMTGTLTWDSLDEEAKENLKGEDGSAEYIMLSGDQVFKYNRNGIPHVDSITLSAITSNLDNLVFSWYYRIGDGQWNLINTTDVGVFTLEHDSPIWGNETAITIRVSVVKDVMTYYDDMTIVKLSDGVDGTKQYVSVTGNQIFRFEGNFNTTPTPSSLTLTGTCYGFEASAYTWYYQNISGEWIKIINENSNTLVIPYSSSYFEDRDILSIKFEAGVYNDVITLVKLLNGVDGYYVLLTNESHVVPCDEDGDYTTEDLNMAKTEIHAYRGTTEIGFAFSKVDNGCSSVYNTSTKTLYLTRLSSDTATVTMSITINNKIFNRVMTITKAKRGTVGQGVSLKGYFNSVDELPKTGNVAGDAYIIGRKLYVWSEKTNSWSDGVEFEGKQGIPGQDGIDGRTTYIHIKYSDDGENFTANNGEVPGKWLGQYVDFIEEDSTDFSVYTWFRIEGEDGYNGIVANLTNDSHTIPCSEDGSYMTDAFAGCITQLELSYNGTKIDTGVTYSYVKSNGINGSFSTNNGKYTVTGWTDMEATTGYIDIIANYEGVNYTKRFTITKIRNGVDSYTVNLSNDSHSFVEDQNGNLIGTTSVTVSITAYKGLQKITPTIGELPTVTGITMTKSGTNVTIRASKTMATSGKITIPVIIGDTTINKDFSYTKVTCGNDGYTVVLSNENDVFNCASDGVIKEEITKTTQVIAYKGTSQKVATVGTLPTVPGLTLSASGTKITIKANVGSDLAETGTFEIPVTVDGLSFTKRFSWTKIRDGSDANIPNWVTDWDGNKTTINSTSVISPKIFAGTLTNGVPTGVALGKNVFGTSGTYSNVNGIVGYKSGTKTYEFNVSGDVLIGNLNGEYISWTSSGLKINSKNITLSSKTVATTSDLSVTESGILSTVSQTYATTSQLNSVNNKFSNYPTTTQMNSAISQKAGEITSSVSATYATKSQLNTVSSNVTQTADKISWIVKSGTSSSNMQLTDKAYQLISQNITLTGSNITLTASNIKLEGYVSANSNFKIDTSGNLIAKNGQFSGTISGTTISGGTIKGASIIGGKFENTSGTFQVDGNSGSIMVGSPLDEGTYIAENGIYFYDSLIEYSAIKRGRFYLYDDNNNGKTVGYLGRNKWVGTEYYLSTINAETNHTVALGAKYASNTSQYTAPIIVSSYNGKITSGFYAHEGLNINNPHTTGLLYFYKDIATNESYPGYISGAGSYGLCITGPSTGTRIRCRNGSSIHACMIFSIDTSQNNSVYADAYHPINMHNYKIYNSSITSSSDRTLKENIKYLNYQNVNPRAVTIDEEDISLDDMYNFINNDYMLASYNYIGKDTKTISAIAQDLLINLDGTDNKVGQLITERTKGVNPEAVDPEPTAKNKRNITPLSEDVDIVEEEEIEVKANETTSEILGINQTELLNVTIGALQKACQEIEILKAKVQELESKK